MLLEELKNEQSSEDKKKLLIELESISILFLKDAAQKKYQLSESLYLKNDPKFLSEISLALKEEPNNLKILQLKSFYFLRNGQCTLASLEIKKIAKLNPVFEALIGLKVYSELCMKRRSKHSCDENQFLNTNKLLNNIIQVISCRSDQYTSKYKDLCVKMISEYPLFNEFKLWCSSDITESVSDEFKEKCLKKEKGHLRNKYLKSYPFYCNLQIASLIK